MAPRRFAAPILLLLSLAAAHCARVLVMVTPSATSHILNLRRIAQELGERGHTVLLSASAADAQLYDEEHSYTPLWYGKGRETELTVQTRRGEGMGQAIPRFFRLNQLALDVFVGEHLQALQGQGIDLLLGDFAWEGSLVMALKLDVPLVTFFPAAIFDPATTSLYTRATLRRLHIPVNLAYVPIGEGEPAPKGLLRRVWNGIQYAHTAYVNHRSMQPFSDAIQAAHGVDFGTREARAHQVLTLAPLDFAFETVRPLPPSVKYVGPILNRPAQPLGPEFQAFVDRQKNGFIVVSFGTITKLGPQEQAVLAAAFSQLPVGVVWKLSKIEAPDPSALPLGPNVMIAPWLPQNDLLGHPKARAFLSHCGINSIYESLQHGVPIVAMPGFIDQPQSAAQAVAKGVGVNLADEKAFTAEVVRGAVLKVLTDPSYAARARHIGTLLRSRQRSPVQEAGDAIDQVLANNGSAYLVPLEDDLPFLVAHGWDVAGFWLAAALALYRGCCAAAAQAVRAVRARGKRAKLA